MAPKIGIRPHNWLDADASFHDIVDWVVRAEERGFDSVHAADRMLAKVPPVYESTMYEVMTALTAYAAHTERVQLSPLVFNLPYRHPVQVAKIFGTLDVIAEGRVILGVGAGWNAHEFDVLEIPRRRRGLRLAEGVEIVKRLWTEDHVDYDGRAFTFEDATIEPKPVQDPHPPIWFGSFGPEVDEFTDVVDRVLTRIGRLGDGWAPLTYSGDAKEMVDPGMLGRAWDRIADSAKEHGRDPDDIEIVYSHWPYVMEDEAAERDRCVEALDWWFDGSYAEAKNTYPIGEPADVVSVLAEATAELPRVDRFIFTPFTYDIEQMDRLADHVVPRVRDRFG